MDVCAAKTHNEVKWSSTWDHYLVCAAIQEKEGQAFFAQQKKKEEERMGTMATVLWDAKIDLK